MTDEQSTPNERLEAIGLLACLMGELVLADGYQNLREAMEQRPRALEFYGSLVFAAVDVLGQYPHLPEAEQNEEILSARLRAAFAPRSPDALPRYVQAVLLSIKAVEIAP